MISKKAHSFYVVIFRANEKELISMLKLVHFLFFRNPVKFVGCHFIS